MNKKRTNAKKEKANDTDIETRKSKQAQIKKTP